MISAWNRKSGIGCGRFPFERRAAGKPADGSKNEPARAWRALRAGSHGTVDASSSRGFPACRLADAGPRARGNVRHGPASATLHIWCLRISAWVQAVGKRSGGSIGASRSRRGRHAVNVPGSAALSVWKCLCSQPSRQVCNGRRAHVCDDYARIAAVSGWTPMMFRTRVRLSASTCNAISAATPWQCLHQAPSGP